MKCKITLVVLLVVAAAATGCFSGSGAYYRAVFENMETALRTKDKVLFKEQWTNEGFAEAVVKNSGLSGQEVFEEGSSEGWYPKPDYSRNTVLGEKMIIETKIWSIEQNRSVDEVHFLLEKEGDVWKVAGGGEDLSEVKSAAKRK